MEKWGVGFQGYRINANREEVCMDEDFLIKPKSAKIVLDYDYFNIKQKEYDRTQVFTIVINRCYAYQFIERDIFEKSNSNFMKEILENAIDDILFSSKNSNFINKIIKCNNTDLSHIRILTSDYIYDFIVDSIVSTDMKELF